MYDKYIVCMFPYPSGSGLHAGHWYNYSIMDSYCRYLRFKGEKVFQPFGFDSHGLPAENYARKVGRLPKEVTDENIINFTKQIDNMDTEFEILLSTHEESYQKYTQFIFTELYKKGLAYKAMGVQDYCPECDTVLAREQVVDNKCERHDIPVEKKELEQWYFKITDYKDRLIENIKNGKSGLPKETANAQLKWLENQHDWCISRQRKFGCPIPIEGETDTMDTFVDSSFYHIVYCILKGIKPIPIDIYVGGREHTCMHLIYIRFINMFLYDIGYIDFEEPFSRVIHQGLILKDGIKMSKSKGNVVNLDNYDSDEIRFYLMFIGHYFDGGSWNDNNIKGIRRFINRFKEWMNRDGVDVVDTEKLKNEVFNYTEAFKFNKVVSSFMIFMNNNKSKSLTKECREEIISLIEIYMPSIRSKINNI